MSLENSSPAMRTVCSSHSSGTATMATRTNPGGYPGFIPPVTPPPASPTKTIPPAVAASFRDWLVTHNWKLHRAGLALLAVSCLVRSFTRGDAAVDDLDVVFVASYTLLGAFLARTFLDPKGYRASFEFHVIVAEAVSTLRSTSTIPPDGPGRTRSPGRWFP